MTLHLLDAMAREGFEQVLALHDRRSGGRAFLSIHDTTRGPAFGGIRRHVYRDEREALLDGLRLARAMTRKCALTELPAGGGKMVLLDRPEVDWREFYGHVGRTVEQLSGRFYTGPDVGTGEQELGWVAAQTSYVTHPGPEGPGELASATAEGVFRGMGAALRLLDDNEDWPERTIVIQGLGAVGAELARRLKERGARVLASDVDVERANEVGLALELELLPPTSELSQPCDVFAPCAMGGILHDLSLERLECRVIAGAANNVLARATHGDRLHERGILFVPDFVLNSGALIRGTLFHLEGRREPVEAIGERVDRILTSVLERARAEGQPPARVAVRIAEERLQAARDGSRGGGSQAVESTP